MPESLKRVLDREPMLEHSVRGLPNLGKNLVTGHFSNEVNKIYDAFGLYGNDLYVLENDRIKDISSRSLGGGSPMRTPAFPLCKEELIKAISSDELSDYPMAAGDENSREIIADYLIEEGFQNFDGITKDNIIFTVSTTHAFNIISNIIARPYDVILMTVDIDKFAMDETELMFQSLVRLFPDHTILTTFKGIEIDKLKEKEI